MTRAKQLKQVNQRYNLINEKQERHNFKVKHRKRAMAYLVLFTSILILLYNVFYF